MPRPRVKCLVGALIWNLRVGLTASLRLFPSTVHSCVRLCVCSHDASVCPYGQLPHRVHNVPMPDGPSCVTMSARCCRTDGACAMATKLVGQSKFWSVGVYAKREPYVITHGFDKLVPGSYAHVTCFKRHSRAFITSRVMAFLTSQVRDWKRRQGFMLDRMETVDGVLGRIVPGLLDEALEPLRWPGAPGESLYALPVGDVWVGKGSRLITGQAFFPVVVAQVEMCPAPCTPPRVPTPKVVAAHCMMPLKPSVVPAPAELLSSSYRPGEHRMLAHAPDLDTLAADERVAAVAVLFSRVSALADFASTPGTRIESDMLRHGASMEVLRTHAAARQGSWSVRHVNIAMDEGAAPVVVHPSGCVDGMNDVIPVDEEL